jgi:hypothetical protein
MQIEKLFTHLNRHKNLLIYLFEHRDRVVFSPEVEEFCGENTLEVLENFEIIELHNEKIFLDSRVVQFLEEYMDGSDTIEISTIQEKIDSLKHKLSILNEHKHKRQEMIPKIRRELKKIDATLFANLDKLRIHIDRVYKSIESFSLKLKELAYYKQRLSEYENALESYDSFLKLNAPMMKKLYNSELTMLLEMLYTNKIALRRSLIPLTQDVIEYINQAQKQSLFIEKIVKLKELKENYELKTRTNIEHLSGDFTMMYERLRVGSRLTKEIITTPSFAPMIQKISKKAKIKSRKADEILFSATTKEQEFINVSQIHLAFSNSQSSLMEFLLSYNKLKSKTIEELSELYCKMVLMYEDEYRRDSQYFEYKSQKFLKVYYADKFR